jgi:putative ABC transport system permease protein
MDRVIYALRFAFRSLRRSALFSVTSILTLGLGIALVTAAFSLVDGVLLRPLPFGDPNQIVTLAQRDGQGNVSGVSYPNFQDWQQQDVAGSFAAMAYARGRGTDLQRPDGAKRVLAAFVSSQFFPVLRPSLLLGRAFTPDEAADGTHVAVLTYPLWRDQFGSDPHAIGRTITTSDGVFTVIGVLSGTTVYPDWAALYLPLQAVAATEHVLSGRDFHADSRAIARLKPGATIARGQEELNAIAKRLASAYPAEDRAWPSAGVFPLRQELFGDAPSRLTIIAVAMALVLIIAWVNLTNLALVRATGRTRELAIRTSLGASRWRIVGQLLTEQMMLALVAGALGAYLAAAVLTLLRGFAAGAPGAGTVAVNGRALLFAAGIAVVSALVIGALPALRAARTNLVEPLKEGGGGSGASLRQQRIRGALVVGEIALALMLVIAAGLLVKSFWMVSHVDPGFNTHGLVAIDLSPPGRRYAEPAQAGAFYTRVLEAVQAIPGVERAALTNHMPLNGAALPTSVEIPGRTSDPSHDPQVLFRTLSPEYIGTLSIPLRHGRNFTAGDLTSGTAVMINETFARTFWPDQDPIGKAVGLRKSAQGYADYGEPLPGIVVGVIGDVHHFGVGTPPVPEIYVPYTRNPWSHMVVVARARTDAAALIPGLRRAILSVDPSNVLTGGTMGGFAMIDDIREGGVSGQRFDMLLLGGFALCALLLSAVGIYGLMAYSVARRTREMGIRMALGARTADVLRLILKSGAQLIVLGVVAGLVGAVALTRLVASMLFGVGATDVPTFVVMTGVLGCVALVACFVPAWRASRVDPVVALRSE